MELFSIIEVRDSKVKFYFKGYAAPDTSLSSPNSVNWNEAEIRFTKACLAMVDWFVDYANSRMVDNW